MNKKVIAIVLAIMMMLPLIPTAAFAASDNMVTRIVTVVDDAKLAALGSIPMLKLTNGDNTWSATETFRISVDDTADWNLAANGGLAADALVASKVAFAWPAAPALGIAVKSITAQIIEVTVTNGNVDDGVVMIPMYVELDGAVGQMKVTVTAMDSALNSGTYIYAIAASGATVVTVGSSKTVNKGANQVGASIVIDETVIGSFGTGDQEFRVRLPADFTWDLTAFGTTVTTVTSSNLSTLAGFALTGDGSRDLIVKFNITATSAVRGSISINPVINVTKDSPVGDVTLDITNRAGDISSAYGVKIAAYKSYGIDISVDDVKDVYAGRVDSDFKTATITIEENVPGSIFRSRDIDIVLPSWVALYDDVTYTVNGGAIATTESSYIDANLDGVKGAAETETYETNEWSIDLSGVTVLTTNTIKITFKLPLTVDGTKSGDIVMEINGAGIDNEELVVAKAVAPVTVTVADAGKVIEAGVRKQVAPDITIKEAYAGALRDAAANNKIDIVLKDALGVSSVVINDFDWEVTAGDIELNDDDTKIVANVIRLAVDADSSKPSTILVKGILLDLDRTVPNGVLRADINGTALVDNAANNDFAGRIARFDYVTVGDIVTPGTTNAKSAFVIGSKDYTVNGVTAAADVAPYIKDGRTFVAVRYIAYALGVSPDSILWDGKDTVTVLGATRIIQLKIGSADMYVNGAKITMDTKAEITSGRSFVPVAWIARAMGVEVAWNQATMTATFN